MSGLVRSEVVFAPTVFGSRRSGGRQLGRIIFFVRKKLVRWWFSERGSV